MGSGSRAERYQVVVHTDAATLSERGELPAPPAPPPGRISNGAPRFVDSAVPLELEALEAVA